MSVFQDKLHDARLFKKSQINASKLIRGFRAGSYGSLFKSQGLEYAESKPYCYGDDARSIDWKLSGRMNALHTKYFHEERNRTVWFIFDCSASMNIGSPSSVYDVAIEAAMTLMLIAFSQRDKVGVVLFDSDICYFLPPTSLSSSLRRIFSQMEAHRFSEKEGAVDFVINFTKKTLPQRSLVVFVSDFLFSQCFERLARLCLPHDVLAVRVFYNMRDDLPNAVLLHVLDAETNERAMLSTNSVKKQYIESQVRTDSQWKSFGARQGASFLEIATTDSVYYKLSRFFQGKKRK